VKVRTSAEQFAIVYLGVATGVLLCPGYNRHEKVVEDLIKCSHDAIRDVLETSDELVTVQCLIALTICSLFSDRAGSTWHLLGLAMTRGIACGLHISKPSQASQPEHARAFWTLFLLDTHVSSALDRPFCIEDAAVTVPETFASEDSIYPNLDQARTLRIMRRFERGGTLSNFINLRHLHESSDDCRSPEKPVDAQAYAAGLVELFKHNVVTTAPSSKMIITETEEVFTRYLAFLEEQLMARAHAPTTLNPMQVFAIGIIMCRLHILGHIVQQRAAYHAVNILTLLSTRYSYVRGFRDVLMECLMTTVSPEQQEPNTRLHDLVGRLEIPMPSKLETMIFGKEPL
jgi:hypothetical protein